MPKGVYKHKSHTEEAKGKISRAMKGKLHGEESKKKMREGQRRRKQRDGYILSFEAREKISKARRGKKHSEETKKKMSDSQKKTYTEGQRGIGGFKKGNV